MTLARICAFSLALLLHTAAFAADGTAAFAQGQKQLETEKYDDAVKSFREAVSQNPNYAQAWYSLGLAYEFLGNSGEITKAFNRAADTFRAACAKDDANSDLWYGLGLVYEHQGKLDQEADAMSKAVDRVMKTPKAVNTLGEAQNRVRYATESAKLRAQKPTTADPENMGPGVNSEADDYFPTSSADGNRIYFTSKRPGGKGGEDLYYVDRSSDSWSAPHALPPPINTPLNEGAATLDGDGQTIIFGACNRPDSLGGCDLYTSTLNGTAWTVPANLGPVVNSTAWEAQPTLSADGSMMIFASRRPGGLGKSDLWMTKRDANGTWGAPTNLGEPVNTPFSEQSPALAPDGKTLYFASSGHPGMGRTDIFKTVLENGVWSEPVNLGQPINSEQDDKFFTIGGDGSTGYFASKRQGGVGGYDLYSVTMPIMFRPEPTLIVTGTISDAKRGTPLEAGLIIQDLKTGDLVSNDHSNSATGKYTVVLPAGRTYSFSVSHPGFFFYSSMFEVPKGSQYKELVKDIKLLPIEKGAHVVLHNVFFEFDKAELSPESQLELNKAVQLLKENPKLVVEVGGHTDNKGKPDYNLNLSAARAKVVREHLIAGGIPEKRMTSKGYGQTVPVADNKTDDGRSQNRRTELTVLDD